MLRYLLIAVALALPLVMGCGEPTVKKYPVSGTVTFDDKPLDDGVIQFMNPEDGGIDSFPIKAGSFKGEVRSGKRKVQITANKEGPSPMPGVKAMINYIPDKYNSKTTLEEEIKAGPNEGLKYDLKSS